MEALKRGEFVDADAISFVENGDRGLHVIASKDIEPGTLLMHAHGFHFNTEIHDSARFLEFITTLVKAEDERTRKASMELAAKMARLCPRAEPDPARRGSDEYDWVPDVDLYCQKLDQNSFDQGVFPSASSFNHSCSPNAAGFSLTKEDGLAIFEIRATRDIASGDEVCLSYLGLQQLVLPADQRRTLLQRSHGFTCDCHRCMDEFSNTINPTSALNSLRSFCPACSSDLVAMQELYVCANCGALVESQEDADQALTNTFTQAQMLPLRSTVQEVVMAYNQRCASVGECHWIRFLFWARLHALSSECQASSEVTPAQLLYATAIDAHAMNEQLRVATLILGEWDIVTITVLEQAVEAWVRVRTLIRETDDLKGEVGVEVDVDDGSDADASAPALPTTLKVDELTAFAEAEHKRLTASVISARKLTHWTIL